jgi:hypothetical protein
MSRSKLFALVTSLTVATSLVPVAPLTFAQSCDPNALVPVKYGQKGNAVKNAQLCLMEAGYDIPAGATGYYGAQTRNAVKEFYSEWYGAWDGNSLGPKGVAQLKKLLAHTQPSGGQPTGGQPTGGQQDTTALLAQVLALLAQGKTQEALQLLTQLMSGQNQQPAPTGQVSVSLSPNNPVGGSLIAGAAQVPVLVFTVSNGTNGDVTITGLTFRKVGVVSDINITNGYLSEGNNILAQFSSFSQGVMTFSGNLVTVPAGQSKELTLRLDVSSGASTGQTVAFELTNVNVSSGQVSGNLPLRGGTYTLTQVSNPSLAQITGFAYQGVTSQVDAGTQGVRIFAASLNVVNSPVKLMSVRFSITGSINPATDLANLVLKVDGQNAGNVSAPDASGKVYVDLGQGFQMGTGAHTLELYADVLGTPNRTFKVEILRPYDVVALDTQYNTYIPVGTPVAGPTLPTEITVRPGQVVMTLASDSPTGNVAKGQSNVVLLKFKMRSAGEAVRIKWLPFKLAKGGGSVWSNTTIDNHVRNVALYDDSGNQVGSTISQLSVVCGGPSNYPSANEVVCSFGSPSSNINYLLPANTERTFTLKVDVQSTTDVNSLIASVLSPADAQASAAGFGGNNIEGQVSFQTSQSQTITGSSLAVATTPFTASRNTSVGTQTYVRGKVGARLASFSLSASSAEGIEVSSLTFNVNDGASGNNLKLQNLKVYVGNNQWGYTVSTVNTNNQTYSFSGVNPFTIPAGGSVIVDVYADVLQSSATGTYNSPVTLTGASAVGALSRASQTLSPASVPGQNVTVSTSGNFTAITVDPSNPPAKQVVLGATNVTLGNYRFTADNNEDIRITDMDVDVVAVNTTTAPATFRNLRLMDGTQTVGNGTALTLVTNTSSVTGDPLTNDAQYRSSFHFTTPLIVPKNQTKTYTLVADVASYSESPSSHNVQYVARVQSVTAVGNDSNASVTVSSPTGFANAQTTLRTKLSVASFTAVGAASGRVRSASDDLAQLVLQVDPAYNAELHSVKLTFSGAAVSNFNINAGAPDTAPVTVTLLDSSNNQVAQITSLTETGNNTGVFTGTLTVSPARVITAGTQDTLKVRVDSSGFNNTANQSDALSVQIVGQNDLQWAEQGASSTNIGLEPGAVPLTVTVSYE